MFWVILHIYLLVLFFTLFLQESGFIILINDKGEPVLEKSSEVNLSTNNGVFLGSSFLVSTESHNLLRKTEETRPATVVAAVKKFTDTNQDSSSVDEVDGSVVAKVSDTKDGTDRVIVHGSNITTANEHEVLNGEALQGVDGDRISSGSLVSQNGIVSECQETENSSFGVETSAAACLGAEPDSVEDEVDEFFDAISTPSPSSKTDSFNEQGAYDHNVLANESAGSSVDPEIRIKEAPNYSSTERQSILLDNVTETESSTDIIDENEEHDIKENITEAECIADTTKQNENLDANSLKEVIECKGEQSVLIETENSFTEVEDLSGKKSAIADNVGEEGIPVNKPEEGKSLENAQTGETLEHINKDSQEVFCDIPQAVEPSDAAASHEEEVADVQNKSDITQSLSCEVPDSTSVTDVNLGNDIPVSCLSEETLQVHTNKQEEEGDAEKSGGAESVDIPSGTVSAEGSTDVKNTQDIVEETGITESIVQDSQDISSVNGTAVLDVTHPTEIKPNDTSEHPDSKNVTETEDEAEQLSLSTQNLETEKNEESEENPICSEAVDSKVISLEEDASCSVDHVTNDNMENSECEEGADSPVRDTMKLGVRTTSIGGSEASEGAALDDYDFDDIDDVLNTDAPSAAGADLNTTPSSEAELSVHAATEPLEQENKSNSKSPSNVVVEKGEDTKAKSSKKSKSEKGKAGKKSNTEKAEKIKSGEKESKEKTEKAKNKESKEKTEKSKSSKKESSHEKKAEKSKNKKDVAQDSRSESVSGEEDKHSIAESQTSLEPDDLEGALDKQMLESEKLKSPKKSSKKLSIFKKVFK